MSRLDWQALLTRISARDGSPSHGGCQQNVNFIGQGITCCAACGRPAGGRVCSYKQRSTGEVIRRRYVRCRGRGDGTCNAPALPLRIVHAHLLTRLSLSHLSQLFPQTQESELGTLQSRVDALLQQIDQQQAVSVNGQKQISALLATAPDAVPVIAQAVADAKRKVETLELELHQARMAIRAMESDAMRQLGEQVVTAASEMLKAFSREEDTAEQRRQINQLLRKLDVRISIDAKAQLVGLAVADGDIDWQPLSPKARLLALREGVVNPGMVREGDGWADVFYFPGVFPDDQNYWGTIGVSEIDDPADYFNDEDATIGGPAAPSP
jgi:hypothetical protein